MKEYTIDDIVALPFPPFHKEESGWVRSWKIILTQLGQDSLLTKIAQKISDSNKEVIFEVDRIEPQSFILQVFSTIHPGSDSVMFATRGFFMECEKRGVQIHSIENIDRKTWSVWLDPLT